MGRGVIDLVGDGVGDDDGEAVAVCDDDRVTVAVCDDDRVAVAVCVTDELVVTDGEEPMERDADGVGESDEEGTTERVTILKLFESTANTVPALLTVTADRLLKSA